MSRSSCPDSYIARCLKYRYRRRAQGLVVNPKSLISGPVMADRPSESVTRTKLDFVHANIIGAFNVDSRVLPITVIFQGQDRIIGHTRRVQNMEFGGRRIRVDAYSVVCL